LVDPDTLESMKNAIQLENQGQPEKPALEIERQLRNKVHEYYYAKYTRHSRT
jgi:pre-mRNA-processing factor 39